MNNFKILKHINRFTELLSNATGFNLYYCILIFLLSIGFNDAPYMIRLFMPNTENVKYLHYLWIGIATLCLYSVLIPTKKLGMYIFVFGLYNIVYSAILALQSNYDWSLYFFIMGLTLMVKYLYELHRHNKKISPDWDKFTTYNIQRDSVILAILVITTKLSIIFSRYFLNYLENYYLELKHSNSYKSVLLFMFIQYKFYASLLMFLVFLLYVINTRNNFDKSKH